MKDDFEDFINSLQEQIYEETKAAYGNAAFERWLSPIYEGAIHDANGCASVTGKCGDTMKMFLIFKNGVVETARFKTDGCGASLVCGSYAAEMAHGKNVDELLDITGDAILEKLNGLPEEEEHCAFLAAETLHEALNYYMFNNKKSIDT